MNNYNNNVEVILKRFPNLNDILKGPKTSEFELLSTPLGYITGKYKGYYIHSRHNPVREATNLIEREAQNDITLGIFFGFGLGYHIEAFLNKYPDIPVLIIEPDVSLFLKTLEVKDLKKVFLSPSVHLYINPDPEGILNYLDNLPLACVQIFRLRSIYNKDREYYIRIDGIISSYISKKEINVNTLKKFGKLWIKNLSKNLPYMIEMPGISLLKNKFKEIPSIILAAGPTLDYILPYLHELRKRMIIISVDTSLKACLLHGVEPDFIVIVDPQYWNTRHIDFCKPPKSILISESSTHPRIFRNLRLKGFFASSFFPLGQFFESIIGVKGRIGAGGSVVTSAWDIGRLIGSNPIVMAGLDLGFPEKRTHYRGAFFEQHFHTISTRTNSVETKTFVYLNQAAPFNTTSNSKGSVLTDKRMIIYKWWFESQMKVFNDVKTYTLSESGIHIKGMDLIKLSVLLDYPSIRTKIDEKLKYMRITVNDNDKKENILQKIVTSTKELLNQLKILKTIAEDGITETVKARSCITNSGIQKQSIDRLNQIDKKICTESSRIIAGFLMQPIIQTIIHASSKNKTPEDVLNNTEIIYKKLKESAAYHIELLNEALTCISIK